MDQPLTRRQRRLLRRQERERQLTKAERRRRIHGGHIVALVILVGLIGAGVYGIRRLTATSPGQTYTAGPVHWHAAIELEVCGEKRDLPGPKDGRMVGNHLHHHHGDNTWHIEGRVIAKEDITLGKFFDEHKIPFDRDQLMDKKNGDECAPGQPGQVRMFVNSEPNSEFRDFVGQYTPNAQDTMIRIVFE